MNDEKVKWWESQMMRKSNDEKIKWWESQLMRKSIDENVDLWEKVDWWESQWLKKSIDEKGLILAFDHICTYLQTDGHTDRKRYLLSRYHDWKLYTHKY